MGGEGEPPVRDVVDGEQQAVGECWVLQTGVGVPPRRAVSERAGRKTDRHVGTPGVDEGEATRRNDTPVLGVVDWGPPAHATVGEREREQGALRGGHHERDHDAVGDDERAHLV